MWFSVFCEQMVISLSVSCLYGTCRFITMCRKVSHLPSSGKESQLTLSCYISEIFISHMCLSNRIGHFSCEVYKQKLYMHFMSTIYASCSIHLILLHLSIIITSTHKYNSSSLLCYFCLPVASSGLVANNLLVALLSNIPSQPSLIKVFSQVSQSSGSNKIVCTYFNPTFAGSTWEV